MGWLISGDRLELVVEPDETRQQFRITGIVFLFETDFVACRERSSRFMKPRQAKDVDSFSLGPQGCRIRNYRWGKYDRRSPALGIQDCQGNPRRFSTG
jgi:hypothetical protein